MVAARRKLMRMFASSKTWIKYCSDASRSASNAAFSIRTLYRARISWMGGFNSRAGISTFVCRRRRRREFVCWRRASSLFECEIYAKEETKMRNTEKWEKEHQKFRLFYAMQPATKWENRIKQGKNEATYRNLQRNFFRLIWWVRSDRRSDDGKRGAAAAAFSLRAGLNHFAGICLLFNCKNKNADELSKFLAYATRTHKHTNTLVLRSEQNSPLNTHIGTFSLSFSLTHTHTDGPRTKWVGQRMIDAQTSADA